MSQRAFSTLDLKPDLLQNLASLGYDTMTPIQAQSLPHILAGKDVIAQGKQGFEADPVSDPRWKKHAGSQAVSSMAPLLKR